MQHPLRRNLCLLYFIMLSKIWCERAAHMASKIKPEGLCCKMAVIKFNRPGKIKGFSAKITSYCMHDWLFHHLHFFTPWACNLTMIKLLIFYWFFFFALVHKDLSFTLNLTHAPHFSFTSIEASGYSRRECVLAETFHRSLTFSFSCCSQGFMFAFVSFLL